MATQVMHRVFGVLQTLERSIQICLTTLEKNRKIPKRITDSLSEQEQIVKKMRRVANKLQLELAKQDWPSIHRSLNIFYALNQMVRPEVMATYKELAGSKMSVHTHIANDETSQSSYYH